MSEIFNFLCRSNQLLQFRPHKCCCISAGASNWTGSRSWSSVSKQRCTNAWHTNQLLQHWSLSSMTTSCLLLPPPLGSLLWLILSFFFSVSVSLVQICPSWPRRSSWRQWLVMAAAIILAGPTERMETVQDWVSPESLHTVKIHMYVWWESQKAHMTSCKLKHTHTQTHTLHIGVFRQTEFNHLGHKCYKNLQLRP